MGYCHNSVLLGCLSYNVLDELIGFVVHVCRGFIQQKGLTLAKPQRLYTCQSGQYSYEGYH